VLQLFTINAAITLLQSIGRCSFQSNLAVSCDNAFSALCWLMAVKYAK